MVQEKIYLSLEVCWKGEVSNKIVTDTVERHLHNDT